MNLPFTHRQLEKEKKGGLPPRIRGKKKAPEVVGHVKPTTTERNRKKRLRKKKRGL